MKKLILILSATVVLAACSKKQDTKPALTPENATPKDLAGTWDLVSTTTYIPDNGKTDTLYATNTLDIKFIFNANGTGSENVAASSGSFTYTLSGDNLLVHVPATANSSAVDNNLTITLITGTRLALRSVSTSETQVLTFAKE